MLKRVPISTLPLTHSYLIPQRRDSLEPSPRGPFWFECSLSLCYWSNFVLFSLWEPVSLTYCVVGGWMGRILAYAAKGVLFILTNGVAPSGVRAQYFEVYATDMHQKLLLVGFDLSTSRSSPNDIVHRTTLA